MSTKPVFSGALVLALFAGSLASAQAPWPGPATLPPSNPSPTEGPPPFAPDAPGLAPPDGNFGPGIPLGPGNGPGSGGSLIPSSELLTNPGLKLPPGTVQTPWLGYQRPGCCGPLGFNGPIGTELYASTGPTLPVAGGVFGHALNTGWMVVGGGRTMFFNPEGSAAWAIDLSLSYQYNDGHGDPIVFVNGTPFTVRALHRTNVNFALGRDWFLYGPGFVGAEKGSNIRVGMDVGGRWGTAHVDLNNLAAPPDGYARVHDVIGGPFMGLHSNWEVPMGGWIFLIGGQVQTGVNFMSLIPGQRGTLWDVNLLLNTGVRF